MEGVMSQLEINRLIGSHVRPGATRCPAEFPSHLQALLFLVGGPLSTGLLGINISLFKVH